MSGHFGCVSGKTVWELHQGRYGDPVFLDQIMDLAEERGLHVDMDGFYRKQQEFKVITKEGNILFNDALNTFYLW